MLRVSLVTLGDPDTLTGGYLYHRRMARAAWQQDAELEFVSFPELPFPLASVAGPHVMRRAWDADVCLLDSICAALAAPTLVAHAGRRAPTAAILHQPPGGIDHRGPRAALARRLDLLAYRRCAALVLASEALREDIPEGLARAARVVVVPPGRDPAPVPGEAPPDMRAGRTAAVLCVGNWMRRKGILELVEAVARLPEKAATLHLVGDTEVEPAYARAVRARLDRRDVGGRTVIHGPLSDRRLATLYGAADLFALPSTREPYGTVYGEAMAHGLPVVGWRAGNLPRLARDGTEGLILEPGDVDGLARALQTLIRDEDLRRRMGDAARRRAARLPTWDASAAALFKLMRELAGGHSSDA